jgi:zinc protease
MFDEARRLQREKVSENELTGIKETLLTGLLSASEATDGQANLLAMSQLLAGDFREATRLIARIRAVSPADVQAFAKKYVRNLQTFGVGSADAIGRVAALAP